MNTGISALAVGYANSYFLETIFTLPVGFDLVFPEHAMRE